VTRPKKDREKFSITDFWQSTGVWREVSHWPRKHFELQEVRWADDGKNSETRWRRVSRTEMVTTLAYYHMTYDEPFRV